MMRNVKYRPQPVQRCSDREDGLWRLIGCGFIVAGLLLLFLCIPGWAWTALAGAALVTAGWALIKTCGR